ncbi:hypothetical protein [Lysobacter gummosus]
MAVMACGASGGRGGKALCRNPGPTQVTGRAIRPKVVVRRSCGRC